MATSIQKRAVVIGTGPMGLETALRLNERGYDTKVFEKGRIGEHIRQWAHVRFFSPLNMNLTVRMRAAIDQPLPPDDAYILGGEFVQKVLEPIARGTLRKNIITGNRVVAIARSGLGKMGLPNHPLRSERSFRVLVEDDEGREHIHDADFVFDASGVYRQANWTGTAGMPAQGERAVNHRIVRHLQDFDGQERQRWMGRRILLIGNGHSAANAVVSLAGILKEDNTTRLLWAVRSDQTKPIAEVPDDPLKERRAIVDAANTLAQRPPQNLRILRRATVDAFESPQDFQPDRTDKSPVSVKLKVWKNFENIEVDEIISLTGYRPDIDMVRELTVDLSNVSEGARGLYRALTNVTDCLAKIDITPKDLQSGEPDFFMVGVKSYGRHPGFLLQSGYEQLDGVFSLIP